MNESLSIALQQHVSTPADVEASLTRIHASAQAAAMQDCALLLFPETSLTGYQLDLTEAQSLAEYPDGPSARFIADICRDLQIAIAYGFIEKADSCLYNSVQLIDSQGKAQALYRKSHLWGDLDRTLFSSGSSLTGIASINDWTIGLLICYDVEFPETVRSLALAGSDLILVPTALMQPWNFVATSLIPVRAYENQLYIASANFCGSERSTTYEGASCIVGPDGSTLARANSTDALLVATLQKSDIQQARNNLPYHKDRRPDLYQSLAN